MKRPTGTLILAATLAFANVAPGAIPLRDQLAAARDAKDTSAQREIILRLLLQSPTDAALLRDLATIQLSAGEHERCAQTLGRWETVLGKPDAELLELRGDLFRATAENDADRARSADVWQGALTLEPERVTVLAKLADYHRRDGQPAAEALYRERLTKLRDDPADHVALARVAAGRRDWDALIRHSTHLREKHANLDNAKAWAAAYDRLMKNAAPLAALDARLEAAPDSIETLLERAWLFDGVGIGEPALDDARRAHKLRPTSFAIRYQLAVIMAHAGQAREAAVAFGIEVGRYTYKNRRPPDGFFEQLTELEPRAVAGDAAALAARSNLLSDEGQRTLAHADALAAVAADHCLIDAQLALARCEQAAGHTAKAKAAYRAALQIDGENLAALKGLGLLQMSLGDYAEAAEVLARHIEIDPAPKILISYERCFDALQKPRP